MKNETRQPRFEARKTGCLGYVVGGFLMLVGISQLGVSDWFSRDLVGMPMLIAGGGLIVFLQTKAGRRRANAAVLNQNHRTLMERNAEILKNVQSRELSFSSTNPPGFILGRGEKWLYHAWGVTAMTMQTVHVQHGNYSSIGFPIGERGLSIDLGQYRSTSVPVTQLTSKGEGSVYVTNQRIVFVGSENTAVVPFESIVNLSAYDDGMRIDIANQSPWVFRTGDIAVAAHTYRALHG